MIRTKSRLRLCTALMVCNLAFIWGNSLMPGWMSQAFSDWVGSLLAHLFSQGPETPGGGLLRKMAHFAEFAALGMLLTWRFGMLGKSRFLSLLWGAAAACVDETIQIFVPERGPGIKDVCIDSCGVLAGMLLLHLGHSYCTRKKKDSHDPWRINK